MPLDFFLCFHNADQAITRDLELYREKGGSPLELSSEHKFSLDLIDRSWNLGCALLVDIGEKFSSTRASGYFDEVENIYHVLQYLKLNMRPFEEKKDIDPNSIDMVYYRAEQVMTLPYRESSQEYGAEMYVNTKKALKSLLSVLLVNIERDRRENDYKKAVIRFRGFIHSIGALNSEGKVEKEHLRIEDVFFGELENVERKLKKAGVTYNPEAVKRRVKEMIDRIERETIEHREKYEQMMRERADVTPSAA